MVYAGKEIIQLSITSMPLLSVVNIFLSNVTAEGIIALSVMACSERDRSVLNRVLKKLFFKAQPGGFFGFYWVLVWFLWVFAVFYEWQLLMCLLLIMFIAAVQERC